MDGKKYPDDHYLEIDVDGVKALRLCERKQIIYRIGPPIESDFLLVPKTTSDEVLVSTIDGSSRIMTIVNT